MSGGRAFDLQNIPRAEIDDPAHHAENLSARARTVKPDEISVIIAVLLQGRQPFPPHIKLQSLQAFGLAAVVDPFEARDEPALLRPRALDLSLLPASVSSVP